MWTILSSQIIKVECSCNCCLRKIISTNQLTKDPNIWCSGCLVYTIEIRATYREQFRENMSSLWGGGMVPLLWWIMGTPPPPLPPPPSVILFFIIAATSGSASLCFRVLSSKWSLQVRPKIKRISPWFSAERGWSKEKDTFCHTCPHVAQGWC